MPARQRGQRAVLIVLLALLAFVTVWQLWPESPAAPAAAPARAPSRAAGRATAPTPASDQVVEVQVAALRETPPAIRSSGRNPFRFQPRLPPPPPPAPPRPEQPVAPVNTGPPPPPPITLKFIGVVTGQAATGKVAVLSDGKFVYYGREGDIIEGRYRLVRIGEESVQMEHVDGRGRQTIRLSGA